MRKNYTRALTWGALLLTMPLLTTAQATNVDIGTGTGTTDNSPIQRFYDYSASELLYLGSEIVNNGMITGVGFYKGSGSTTTTIDSVYIYMKTTTATALTTMTSMTGYTLVYAGAFPNTVASGWCTVDFNAVSGFAYGSNTDNLSLLIVKPYQAALSTRPFWRYTDNVGPRNAWYRSASPWTGTMAEISNWRPNIRLTFSTPLPIELGRIDVVNKAGRNLVTWNTHKEARGDNFELQRSVDGIGFATIARVAAKGEGPADYAYDDDSPYIGKNYYRLRMIDIDGKVHFSEIVSALSSTADHKAVLKAFPCPAIEQLNVISAGNGYLQLISMDGRVLSAQTVNSVGHTSIDTREIPSGLYLLKHTNENLTSTIIVSRK